MFARGEKYNVNAKSDEEKRYIEYLARKKLTGSNRIC